VLLILLPLVVLLQLLLPLLLQGGRLVGEELPLGRRGQAVLLLR
jgi:hypothetical protein